MLEKFTSWIKWLVQHRQPIPSAVYLVPADYFQLLQAATPITHVRHVYVQYKVAGVEIRLYDPPFVFTAAYPWNDEPVRVTRLQ
jgi:hypothetical protein